MKIREIIELTQTEPLSEIAKNHLEIGREKTRNALKKAGATSENGKRGWTFSGDESVLEQSIYDFAEKPKINRKKKPSPNVSTKRTEEQRNIVSKEPMNESVNDLRNESINELENQGTNVGSSGLQKKSQSEKVEEKKESTKELTNVQTNEARNEGTKVTSNVVRKRSSFDIDIELMKELKIQAIIHDKNVYEIVETAIRQHLQQLKKGD